MKRLFVLAAALTAFAATAPVAAHAEMTTTDLITKSTTSDLLNLIPGLGGSETRHLCLVFQQLDVSYCIYVPLP